MAQLMEMIRQRQGGLSTERYANMIGTTSATLYSQYNGTKRLGIDALQIYASYYKSIGDEEMINALASYALGFEVKAHQNSHSPSK